MNKLSLLFPLLMFISHVSSQVVCEAINVGETCLLTPACVWLPFATPPRCGDIGNCADDCAGCTQTDCETIGADGNCAFNTVTNVCFGTLCDNDCQNCDPNAGRECEDSFAAPNGCTVSGAPGAEQCLSNTLNPTLFPTTNPTQEPTVQPTVNPTTGAPTSNPSANPTANPTVNPTANPVTASPTSNPTINPVTTSPTGQPTVNPTVNPTSNPTLNPVTSNPTGNPTANPTPDSPDDTTATPTSNPTVNPVTNSPTGQPTANPTVNPTTPSPTLPCCCSSASESESDSDSDSDSTRRLLSSDSDSDSDSASADEPCDDTCECLDSASASGSASASSSDSSEAVTASPILFAAGNVENDIDHGLDALMGDAMTNGENGSYEMDVSFTKATYLNVWGMVVLFLLLNGLCCFVCYKRKTQHRSDSMNEFEASNLEIVH